MLNEQQQDALELICESESGAFLSGIAGAGKTFLLQEVIRELHRRKRKVRVTAFTGLAAQHLNGTTIAKLLGLGLSSNVTHFPDVNLLQAERNLDGVTDLIVDEISMCSGDFLELVDQVLRTVTGRDTSFGGIRVILSGDFMQLPPVRAKGEPNFRYPWAFEYPEFSKLPSIFLTHSMRQTSLEEIDLLNEFRQGMLSPRAKEFLDSLVGKFHPQAVDLYPLRRDVEAVNQARLKAHPGQLVTYPTEFHPRPRTKELLSQIPVGEKVELKSGVPVIVLCNDPGGKYVNGSQGRVLRLADEAVEIEFLRGNCAWVEYKTWEVLDPTRNLLGTARGLPVTLGWAATIHRSQGMTLDAVVTDISRCWEPGQAYVALSRTRSLENLGLISPVPRIHADPVARNYVNSLF